MSLENIAGYENEKKDLLSLRKMLHNADTYRSMGIRMPRGVIFYGQPGVGKSLMVRSIPDDGIALVELRAADCCSDNTEEAVRTAFENAKACAPSVLLLDELDKIAGTSNNFFMENNDDVKKILLQELDRLEDTDTVLVVATSNDIDSLGDALLRPGRFDRSIQISEPDEKTRYKILDHYLSRLTIRKKVDLKYLAKITVGFTAAMIECLVNESAIYVLDSGKKTLTLADMKCMINRMIFASYETDPNSTPDVLRQIAVHEAGHALVAMMRCPDKLQGATVKPQGDCEGRVEMVGNENSMPSLRDIENDITVALGGRVAERVINGDVGVGAESDIRKASYFMMRLITSQAKYGYKYTVCAPIHPRFEDIASEEVKNEICELFDREMTRLDREAERIILDNRDIFERIVDALVTRKILSREELFELRDQAEAA